MYVSVFAADSNATEEARLSFTPSLFQSDTDEEFNWFSDL